MNQTDPVSASPGAGAGPRPDQQKHTSSCSGDGLGIGVWPEPGQTLFLWDYPRQHEWKDPFPFRLWAWRMWLMTDPPCKGRKERSSVEQVQHKRWRGEGRVLRTRGPGSIWSLALRFLQALPWSSAEDQEWQGGKDGLQFCLLIREGFSNQIKCALSCMCSPFSHVQLFVTSGTVACQALLSMGPKDGESTS